MASLDAQTLSQNEFEIIVVDDGSPDGTIEQLRAAAAVRPNMSVRQIPNSGWGSRPRNVGMEAALGEYVFFMDHDDSLYPDALRKLLEYAHATRADVVSPKESKTNDIWWSLWNLPAHNIANALSEGGIARLLPMVPHKLYRRAFLSEHGIRFREGRRMLWEDIYLNVEVFRHAERVAVLADSPVYLWHAGQTNNSATYSPDTTEFWDRLDDLFEFLETELAGAQFNDARKTILLHQFETRVLRRFSRILATASSNDIDTALRRAQRIQQQHIMAGWEDDLGKIPLARTLLLRQGRTDLLRRLYEADSSVVARTSASGLAWKEGKLCFDISARWTTKVGKLSPFERVGETVRRRLPPDVARALPREALDVTHEIDLPCCLGGAWPTGQEKRPWRNMR